MRGECSFFLIIFSVLTPSSQTSLLTTGTGHLESVWIVLRKFGFVEDLQLTEAFLYPVGLFMGAGHGCDGYGYGVPLCYTATVNP